MGSILSNTDTARDALSEAATAICADQGAVLLLQTSTAIDAETRGVCPSDTECPREDQEASQGFLLQCASGRRRGRVETRRCEAPTVTLLAGSTRLHRLHRHASEPSGKKLSIVGVLDVVTSSRRGCLLLRSSPSTDHGSERMREAPAICARIFRLLSCCPG